jgi:hypothetical protein
MYRYRIFLFCWQQARQVQSPAVERAVRLDFQESAQDTNAECGRHHSGRSQALHRSGTGNRLVIPVHRIGTGTVLTDIQLIQKPDTVPHDKV